MALMTDLTGALWWFRQKLKKNHLLLEDIMWGNYENVFD